MRYLNGHNYELGSEMGTTSQFLRFYEFKDDGTKIDGVTNEEVLEVLIHRLQYLNAKLPCMENIRVLELLRDALYYLNRRTKNRRARGVEGTHNL